MNPVNEFRSGLNLITAFALALKHRLRHQPYTMYYDIDGYLRHLETFAGTATAIEKPTIPKTGFWKEIGQDMGFSFAQDNPLKEIKKCDMPLGNLPLELLAYMGAFIDQAIENKMLNVPMQQSMACKYFRSVSALFKNFMKADSV
jgi:putative membrane protein